MLQALSFFIFVQTFSTIGFSTTSRTLLTFVLEF
jgi:hypothetical protein